MAAIAPAGMPGRLFRRSSRTHDHSCSMPLLFPQRRKTALITTGRGFRDVLEIARGKTGPDLFNSTPQAATSVPRSLRTRDSAGSDIRVGVARGRRLLMSCTGLRGSRLRAEGVKPIAVCFLHPLYQSGKTSRLSGLTAGSLWPSRLDNPPHTKLRPRVASEIRAYEPRPW